MLELFFKHLDFCLPELTEREYKEHEKFTYEFINPIVNKHWRSFYATYNRGYNDALNNTIIPLMRELRNQ